MSKSKEPYERYTRKTPRKETEVTFQCFADSRMFVREFADMPKGMQEIFRGKDRISLPCEGGGGVPGSWCEDCVFGKVVD